MTVSQINFESVHFKRNHVIYIYVQTRVAASVEVPLPEELLSQLKSTEWKERYQGVTKLEQLIDSGPQSLGSHTVKVHKDVNVTCIYMYCILIGI